MPRVLILTCLSLLLASPAGAEEIYAWTQPPAEQQLSLDETPIPVGMGAVFVPSITGPEYEPPVTLVGGDDVRSLPLGERVLVPPGQYVVVVSAGTPDQGVAVSIDVVEGETALVPVKWGALRVEVTDDHRIPHRGTYEIIRADTREPVGTGFGADTLQGEILQTWLLAPGLYRIALPGRSSRVLRDFATVDVPEAGFVRFRLVQDPDTQAFEGAGVLLPEEFAASANEGRRWFRSLVVGADGELVQSENVAGAANQRQWSVSGYLDAQVAWTKRPHRFASLLQVQEGVSRIVQNGESLPLLKGTDLVRGDALYTWSRKGSTGPYGRWSVASNALPTEVLAATDTTFQVHELDGSTSTTLVPANETFRLAEAGYPTLLREGVGINTSFLRKRRSINFNYRLGYGMRQSLYDGTLSIDDDPDTDQIEYNAVDSFYEEGIESTVVASVRLPGWVVYSTDVELFADFHSFTEPWERTDSWRIPYPPWALSWRNTLSLRITRNLSLNYYLNIDLEPQVLDKPQWEQRLLLRTSWSLF